MIRRSVIDKAVVLPTVMLALVLIFPASLGKLKYLPVYKAVVIKQNKKLPPHIAYLESYFEAQKSEWLQFEKPSAKFVDVGTVTQAPTGQYALTQKRVLTGVVIRKNPELLALASGGTSSSNPDVRAVQVYKTSSQILEENEGPQWLQNATREPAMATAPQEQRPTQAMGAKRISGPLEISGGLAVTNDHHIEVRRASDGVFQEMGKVDLLKGSYSIDVTEPSGMIVARLIDKTGAVLGEGSVRLSQLQQSRGKTMVGPRIELAPNVNWGGRVSQYYPPARGRKNDIPTVTTYGGENKVNVAKTGEISFDSMGKNSSTVVRAQTVGHWASSKLMVAGETNFNIPLFPDSMMAAFTNLVSDPTEPRQSEDVKPAMVWGTVKIDGKPLSGVVVRSESDPEAKPVYFNEFMIPDAKLTATSTNGLYAFTNMQEGFHALLALRGDAYFGHQNVVVQKGTVAIGDILNTLRTEATTIRAFDAFTGEPGTMTAHLQSLQEPVQFSDGTASVILPQVPRMSLIYTEETNGYLKANYFYNDVDSYIHLPMIKEEWLTQIRSEEKVNQEGKVGTIVGFVSEDDFEVYLAGAGSEKSVAIAYFDATGRRTFSGHAGGGFVIFNAPRGLQEAVVVGKSEKILSKVVPVDENSLSILSFNAY